MNRYLIELRILGKAKYEVKSLIKEVDYKFRLKRTRKHRPVPHISLAGPFTIRNQRKLVSDFKKLCMQYNLMNYIVEGYETFEDSKVVYINVKADKQLDDFRWKLSNTLKEYCYLKPHDLVRKFYYHITIAMRIPQNKFKSIKRYINNKPKPNHQYTLMRIAIIKNSRILYEYDFLQNRLLNRREAKSKRIMQKSFSLLKENTTDKSISIDTLDLNEEKGIFSSLLNFFRKKKVFVVGDLHLDHTNIIKYCKRPFKNTKEMNKKIINNWNNTVDKGDTILFLGDMAFGKGSKKTSYWLKKLNGNIIFIKGNHDRSKKIRFYDKVIIKYGGEDLLLVHDPRDIPEEWNGWTICGHHHNNNTKKYPFINGKTKQINVGVELINYAPLNMDGLFEIDYKKVKYKEDLNGKERF